MNGVATVIEGEQLSIKCDSSNSFREPLVIWLDPEGGEITDLNTLVIDDIDRTQTGTYTCRTLPPDPDNSRENSVEVVVQCKFICWLLLATKTLIAHVFMSR